MLSKILLSFCFILIFGWAGAQEIPDSLKSKLSGKSPAEQITYLNKLANEQLKSSPAISYALSKASYKIAVSSANKNAELNSLLLAGKSARLSGKAGEGIDYINKAITMLTAANHTQGLASAYNEMGLACKEAGKSNDAISAFENSSKFYMQLKDNKNQYLVSNNIGAIYSKTGQHQKSIDAFKKALTLAETIGDKKEIASSHNQLGVAYVNYGNFTEAGKSFASAKEIATALNNSSLLASINKNIESLNNNLANKEKSQTSFDSEKDKQQQEYVSSLQNENQFVKQQNLKSMSDIENLSAENQAKELKLHVLQGQYEKQVLENQLKENNLKLLESENKLNKAELEKKQEALNYQRKLLWIVLSASIVLLILVIFIYRLYVSKKKTLKIVQAQKNEIQKQKDIIQEGIDYARHIQQAIIPSPQLIQAKIPGFYSFLKPRDVVSGDFYWFHHDGNKSIIAAIDCTGHGVAGGLMSMIANSLLNRIIKEGKEYEPDKILRKLNDSVVETLAQSGDYFDSSMDITVCVLDDASKQISLSLAGHRCVAIRNNEIKEMDGADSAIGGLFPKMNLSYDLHTFPYESGLDLFMFSDGFPDQDGASGKKMGSKAFTEILLNLSAVDPSKRVDILQQKLDDWRSGKKQRDDILVMGFRL